MRGKTGAIGRWATLVGVLLQVVGLGTTVLRQGASSDTSGGPGFVVFLLGLGLTLLGLLLFLGATLAGRRESGSRGMVRVAGAVAVTAVLVLAGGSFAYALQNSRAVGAHSDAAVHFKNAELEALEGGFHQDNHTEVPVTYDQMMKVSAMLGTMRAASAPYKDVNAALAAGYQQITQDIPMLGAHFVNFSYLRDGAFDPSRPPILLYERAHARWNLVGVSYLVPRRSATDSQPDVIPGPLAVWHDHQNLCITRALHIAVLNEQQCVAKNAFWLRDTGWMVHVWIWKDSPQGVFSHVNSTVN
ncbi:MAG: hypothetical protein NVSMB65_00020 [Chloroflexota bacterium]